MCSDRENVLKSIVDPSQHFISDYNTQDIEMTEYNINKNNNCLKIKTENNYLINNNIIFKNNKNINTWICVNVFLFISFLWKYANMENNINMHY